MSQLQVIRSIVTRTTNVVSWCDRNPKRYFYFKKYSVPSGMTLNDFTLVFKYFRKTGKNRYWPIIILKTAITIFRMWINPSHFNWSGTTPLANFKFLIYYWWKRMCNIRNSWFQNVHRNIGLWWHKCNYTVSQKTSHLWLTITLAHTNGFWYFLFSVQRRKVWLTPTTTVPYSKAVVPC